MPRRSREDEPGCFLHIFNRGLAKRSVFENRADVRYFLSRLAREHRRGRLLVHAYAILGNHFHILAESPVAAASEAMRVIQNEYVRRFNRLRGRDGPLFRGRFGSRRVKSDCYWWTLIRYIELNAADARLVAGHDVYPYASAAHYLRREGPPWLTRTRVEAMLLEGTGLSEYRPELYARLLDVPLDRAEAELVDLRMRGGPEQDDPLDRLWNGGPPQVREWMLERATKADGTRPGIPILSPSLLDEVIARVRETDPGWTVKPRRQRRDAWGLLHCGLLREACGLSFPEIGFRLGVSTHSAESRLRDHWKLVTENEGYAVRVTEVFAAAFAGLRTARPQTPSWCRFALTPG